MTPEIAERVLERYQRTGPRLNSSKAREIIVEWLRARGVHEDHYGNFKLNDDDRYHFSKTKLQRQSKGVSGWSNINTSSLIDAATLIVKKAAEATSNEALVTKLGGASIKRAEARTQKREQSRAERLEQLARDQAVKVASQEMPEQFVAWYLDHETQPEFGVLVLDLKRKALAVLERGETLSDQGIMSAAAPPVAPLLLDLDAIWVENQGGVDYTIHIKHVRGRGDTAAVHIGKTDPTGFSMAVDPLSHRVDWGPIQVHAKGDGYMSGWVAWSEDGPTAGMFMIIAHEKQQGAGGRILDIWCRMLDAYGIGQWTAEAVGPEGRAFIDAKIRAGRLELLRERGSSLLVRCVDPRQGRLGL